MTTATKTKVVDVVDHGELLLLFRKYVDQCIEENKFWNKQRPLSFDEWYNVEYLPNTETLTSVINVVLWHEQARGGFLCGSTSESFEIRVPAYCLNDENRLRQVARKFSGKMNRRLPWVIYDGRRIDHWTWES